MNTLALLIDIENASPKYTNQIIRLCETYGTIKKKFAYANWKKRRKQRGKLTKLGINCKQPDRVGKNAADFALIADADLMLENNEVGIYVIVSNDTDFAPTCRKIHQKGAKVYGIGSKANKSIALRKACDKFIDVEYIAAMQNKVSTTSTTPKTKAKPKFTIKTKTILRFLIRAYQQTRGNDELVLLSRLGTVLRKLDNQYDKRYAGKHLSTWLKGFPHKFIVEGNLVRLK